MGKLVTGGFRRATSIPRRLKIIPQNAATPQGALDIVRGKTAPQESSLLGKPLAHIGRSSRTLLGTEKKRNARGKSLST